MELKAAKQKIHYQALAMTLKDHTMESILQESKLSDYIKPFAEGQLTLEAVLTESSDAKVVFPRTVLGERVRTPNTNVTRPHVIPKG
eukprot:186777-Amorphochlora_amoeboformis.AAC.1